MFNWGNIDAQIPVHYGRGGVIDRFGDKSELIFVVVASWIMFIGFYLLSKFPKLWNISQNVSEYKQEKTAQVTSHLLNWEMLIFTMNFCFLSLQPLTNKNLPSFYTMLVLGAVFGMLAIYLIKVFLIK